MPTDVDMEYLDDEDGNRIRFVDTTARETKCAGAEPSRSGTSLALQMDAILSSGKVGVFPMYCSSGNADFSTIGYCMALGITSKASDVSAIVAFNTQTNDIWLNCNTANTPSGWTGWKKISRDSGTTLGSSVSLKSYSSSTNKYTVPNDGYVIVYAGSGTGFSLNADSVSLGSEIMKISSSDAYTRQAIFVKKGMKVYGSPVGGSSYDFYYQPLQ